MLQPAFELAKKDLKIYFRDPIAWLLGFLLPIVLVTIFGFLMGAAWGGNGPAPRVKLYVVDEDKTLESQTFVDKLRDSDMLSLRPREGQPAVSADDVEQMLRDGEISHALIIQSGFAKSLDETTGEDTLRLLRDPGRDMEDQIVRINLMQAIISTSGGTWWVGAMNDLFADAGVPASQLDSFVQQANLMNSVIDGFDIPDDDEEDRSNEEDDGKVSSGLQSSNPMEFMTGMLPVQTEDFSPPERPKQATFQIAQAVAGMTVMMLMFGVASCGRTLLQERDQGTLARLLSVGVPRASLLLGTTLFTVVVGILQMVVLFIYGELMFDIGTFSNPVTLSVLGMLWIVTATSLGILIAASSKSEKQADMMSTILIISLAALGGCWFPLQMVDLPRALELITQSTPTYWAMTGFQNLFWNGAGLSHPTVQTSILVMAGYSAVLMTMAIWLFRRNFVRG